MLQDDEQVQAGALVRLSDLVEKAEGAAAESIGKTCRDFGVLEPLVGLMQEPATQREALFVIRELTSEDFDTRAKETRQLLHDLGAFPNVVKQICAIDHLQR